MPHQALGNNNVLRVKRRQCNKKFEKHWFRAVILKVGSITSLGEILRGKGVKKQGGQYGSKITQMGHSMLN